MVRRIFMCSRRLKLEWQFTLARRGRDLVAMSRAAWRRIRDLLAAEDFLQVFDLQIDIEERPVAFAGPAERFPRVLRPGPLRATKARLVEELDIQLARSLKSLQEIPSWNAR
jgi:hypothetical protein